MPSRKSAAAQQTIDFDRSVLPRYVQLATLFRGRIRSGDWSLNAQIPTVDDLSAQYAVARATIRQALGLLEDEGLISRQRAKGTFVTHRPQSKLWCEVSSDLSGLLRAREGAVIELLSEERQVQARSAFEPSGKLAPAYRHLRRRHWRDTQPYLLADVYIDENLCARIPRAAFKSKPALQLISDIPGTKIVEACQTLTIGQADVATASLLQVPLNAPVAFVHRWAADKSGRVVLIADGIYRGDVVRLDVQLK
jgi:GntR family transcriptional regulator